MQNILSTITNAVYSQRLSYSSIRSRVSEDETDSSSQDGLIEKPDFYRQPHKSSFWRRNAGFVLLQIVLLLVYSVPVLVLAARLRDVNIHGPPLVRSPARDAVIWEEKKFVLGDRIQEKSVYSGKPNAELNRAWHDLLNDENIRIEGDIIRELGREQFSVKVPGEDNYIGTLNVYHELHCLKRLHQYMYQDIYWNDLTDAQREMNRLHNEHCIDFLRQSAMCHGDVGLITFSWSPTERIPVANATTHQCVNWDKIDQWSKDRSVDMMKPGWLVHPTLGLAYPDGKGDRIGAAVPAQHNH